MLDDSELTRTVRGQRGSGTWTRFIQIISQDELCLNTQIKQINVVCCVGRVEIQIEKSQWCTADRPFS